MGRHLCDIRNTHVAEESNIPGIRCYPLTTSSSLYKSKGISFLSAGGKPVGGACQVYRKANDLQKEARVNDRSCRGNGWGWKDGEGVEGRLNQPSIRGLVDRTANVLTCIYVPRLAEPRCPNVSQGGHLTRYLQTRTILCQGSEIQFKI